MCMYGIIMSALIHTMIGKHHLKLDMLGNFFEQSVTKMLDHYTAKVSYQEQPEQIRVQAEGVLRTGKQEGTCKFQVQYEFAEDKVCWNVTSCDYDAVFYLPVVSECTETVTADGNQLRIQRANGKTLCIQADARILVETDSYYKGRMFNPVGGMQALDCRIRLKKGVPVSIQMTEE